MPISNLQENLNDIASDIDNEGGLVLGSASTSKFGAFGVTPVVQPAAADQAALGAMTNIGSNAGAALTELSLIGNTADVDQSAALMGDLRALQEDINAIGVLLTEIRTVLVNVGIMKGAA